MSNLMERNKEGLDFIDSKGLSSDVDEYWYYCERLEPVISNAIEAGFKMHSIELILALAMRTAYENG